jgi:hypothetical protein
MPLLLTFHLFSLSLFLFVSIFSFFLLFYVLSASLLPLIRSLFLIPLHILFPLLLFPELAGYIRPWSQLHPLSPRCSSKCHVSLLKEGVWGSGGAAPRVHVMEASSQLVPAALLIRTQPQSRFGHSAENESICLLQESNLDSSIINSVL